MIQTCIFRVTENIGLIWSRVYLGNNSARRYLNDDVLFWNVRELVREKRTYLAKNMMSHKWFANLDSDDIYFPGYLKYSITQLKEQKKCLSSSNQMLFLFPHHDYKICAIACQAVRQCHEACMVGTKQYLRSMNYFDAKDSKGEGASIIDGNEQKVVNLDIQHLMICVCYKSSCC